MNSDTSPVVRIFETPQELARNLAGEWKRGVARMKSPGSRICIALSGGSTPRLLFETLARPEFRESIPWQDVHLFWGDERCVAPYHPDSNYRMARETLLRFLPLAPSQIHRIHGEADPHGEAVRYAEEIRRFCGLDAAGHPRFDWILLGLGADGHTASLFPGADLWTEPSGVCAVAAHPESGQLRVSLTLDVLSRARRVSFLVSGAGKAEIVRDILKQVPGYERYPAAGVQAECVEWWLDRAAAAYLDGD